jgi:hypothetical protein
MAVLKNTSSSYQGPKPTIKPTLLISHVGSQLRSHVSAASATDPTPSTTSRPSVNVSSTAATTLQQRHSTRRFNFS